MAISRKVIDGLIDFVFAPSPIESVGVAVRLAVEHFHPDPARRPWEEMYLAALEQAVKELEHTLRHHTGADGDIRLDKQRVLDALRGDLALDGRAESELRSAELQAEIVNTLVRMDALMIGGHRLTQDETRQLIGKVVEHAPAHFRAMIEGSEEAFRKALEREALRTNTQLADIDAYLNRNFGLALGLLQDIKADTTAIITGVENLPAAVVDLQDERQAAQRERDRRKREDNHLKQLIEDYKDWHDLYTDMAGTVRKEERTDARKPLLSPAAARRIEMRHAIYERIDHGPDAEKGKAFSTETLGELREGLRRHQRAALIGDPGAGKTTTLERLAYEYAAATSTATVTPTPTATATSTPTATPAGIACSGGVGDASALQAAVSAAGTNGIPDTIALTGGCTYTLSTTLTVAADSGQPLTIIGNGAVISGNNAVQILSISSGAVVSVQQVSITSGFDVRGGGIYSAGTLTLSGSTITSSRADHGGGIENAGNLSIVGSTITGNTVTNGGGGLLNSGTLNISSSTISGNTAIEWPAQDRLMFSAEALLDRMSELTP